MAIKVGSLFVSLVAKVRNFTEPIKRAGLGLRVFAGKVKATLLKLKGFAAALAGIAATSAGLFARKTIEGVVAQAKFAERIGISLTALLAFQNAAKETGLELGVMQRGLEEFSKRLSEAARLGKGEAVEGLQLLKLNAKDLIDLDLADAVQKVSMAFANLSNQSDKALAADKLFSAQELVSIFDKGNGFLQEQIRLIKEAGTSLDKNQIQKFDELNTSINRASIGLKGKFLRALSSISGPLISITRAVTPSGLRAAPSPDNLRQTHLLTEIRDVLVRERLGASAQ